MNFKNDKSTTAFLPIRAGSERIKDKNFRLFNNVHGGLFKIKLKQLLSSQLISNIIISYTDERVFEFLPESEKIKVIERPKNLGLSNTVTDDLIHYALNLEELTSRFFLWTHVTSPLFGAAYYDDFIAKSINAIENGHHDSSATVCKHQGYFVDSNGRPLYDSDASKWPATQTVQPIFEYNNAGFFGELNMLKVVNDRIGQSPYLYETPHKIAVDIDWIDDFRFAEELFKYASE